MGNFSHYRRPASGVRFSDCNSTIVFDTVCTKDRSPWLANEDVHNLLIQSWKRADSWLVGDYVILPDHIHNLVRSTGSDFSLDRWVNYWKFCFTREHKVRSHKWMIGHWDRRIRDDHMYRRSQDYILDNPVKHGYVSDSSTWSFRGSLYDIPR